MLPVNSSWDEFECKSVCISEPARKLHDEKEQRLNIKQKHTNTTRGGRGLLFSFETRPSNLRPCREFYTTKKSTKVYTSIVHSSPPWGTGVEVGRSRTVYHRTGSWACSHPCDEAAHTWGEEEEVGEDHKVGTRASHNHCRDCSMVWREGEE